MNTHHIIITVTGTTWPVLTTVTVLTSLTIHIIYFQENSRIEKEVT